MRPPGDRWKTADAFRAARFAKIRAALIALLALMMIPLDDDGFLGGCDAAE